MRLSQFQKTSYICTHVDAIIGSSLWRSYWLSRSADLIYFLSAQELNSNPKSNLEIRFTFYMIRNYLFFLTCICKYVCVVCEYTHILKHVHEFSNTSKSTCLLLKYTVYMCAWISILYVSYHHPFTRKDKTNKGILNHKIPSFVL